MNMSLLGIGLAKNVFQLHGVDPAGKAVMKKRISRDQLAAEVANLPLCTRLWNLVEASMIGPE